MEPVKSASSELDTWGITMPGFYNGTFRHAARGSWTLR
jgi:hypothetical protein